MPTATKRKRKTTRGLSNPAVAVAAQSPAGQKAIGEALTEAKTTIVQARSTVATVVKVVLIAAVAYAGYSWYTGRFRAIGTNTNNDPANITDGQAQTKANAIYQAMVGFGANFDTVLNNLIGLNYNGWVKVYNAFGKREGIIPFSAKMDLAEWLVDQFSESDLDKLRFHLGNGLF